MERPLDSRLYLINGATYLHIHEWMDQFDYILYDKETMRQIYHGQVDAITVPEQPVKDVLATARYAVFNDYGITAISVEEVPLDILQTLKNTQLDPPLDEYPRPDDLCTMSDIACMGYLNGDLLPISDDIAEDLFQQGFAVYEVNAHGEVHGPIGQDMLQNPNGNSIFAVSRVGWQNSQTFRAAVADRMDHQMERELSFRCQKRDCFAIYQLNHHDPEMRYIRYESLESLQKQGQHPQKENYELVYTAPLPEGTGLNALWEIFNTDHPPDYQHPSMSISDVVAVKKDGALTCYYVDRYNYAVLDDFLTQRPRQMNRAKLHRKPSIKAQLATKPVPGDKPTTKPKDREVR